jgi:hypothetical protein
MTVKELKQLLEKLDENLEVCYLNNGGHGYGELPFEIKPTVKEVLTYDGVYKKMVIVNQDTFRNKVVRR